MARGILAFSQGFGANQGLDRDLVERIKHLRDPRQRNRTPQAKMRHDVGGVRKLGGRPIHGQQAVTVPSLISKLMVKVVHLHAVQLHKSVGL